MTKMGVTGRRWENSGEDLMTKMGVTGRKWENSGVVLEVEPAVPRRHTNLRTYTSTFVCLSMYHSANLRMPKIISITTLLTLTPSHH